MTRHHRIDLDCPFWWARALWALAVFALLAVLLIAWLAQGLVVLPAAAIARASGNDRLARRMTGSLRWLPG